MKNQAHAKRIGPGVYEYKGYDVYDNERPESWIIRHTKTGIYIDTCNTKKQAMEAIDTFGEFKLDEWGEPI